MSKIFDALQGIKSEASELLAELIPAADEFSRTADPQRREGRSTPPPKDQTVYTEVVTPGRRAPLVVSASVPLLPFDDPANRAAEQYRIARTKITHHPKRPQTILISSANSGDGKTVTAINLSGVLSLRASAKVLLVDLDFRKSSVHALLGLSRSPGLAEIIIGECSLEDAVVETEQYPNLHILTSGESKVNPSELLESPRWHTLCEVVRARYQYVIFDTPPMASVAEYELMQLAGDAVVMVIRPDHTNRKACFGALESIPKEKLVGIILNCTTNWPFSKQSAADYSYYLNTGQTAKNAAGSMPS